MKFQFINNHLIFIIFFTILIPANLLAYAEKTHQIQIDDDSFDIKYNFEGDVIAMEIDKELHSLLIATENVKNSQFDIILPSRLISAENNEFVILVNGFEVGYQVNSLNGVHLTFFIPDYTEEIEIIGTHVIPEFPLGMIIILSSVMSLLILFQKTKILFK